MKVDPRFPAACLLAASFSVEGAEISWTVSNITGKESDVSNAGTTVIAASGANGAGTRGKVDGEVVARVNGVAFTDAFTVDNPSHFDTFGRRANSGIPANSQYQELLKHGDRDSSGQTTLKFDGLKIGHTYQIQIWVQDNIQNAGVRGIVLNSGGMTAPDLIAPGHVLLLVEASGENTSGQFALGTFVADSTTQEMRIQSYEKLDTISPKKAPHVAINAYQLRDLGAGEPD